MSTRKVYTTGTHRVATPEHTLQQVQPLLAAVGITRIANVTGLDHIGLPVVMVTRPLSRSIAVSQGKGLSLAAAKASGVMEAIETYYAERITQPVKLARYADLVADHRLVDLQRLPKSRHSPYHHDWPLAWIEAQDILQQHSVWLPLEFVSTDYTLPLSTGFGCFPANTNGLASGNVRIEAIAHGVYEVIERDAIALWKQQSPSQQRASRVDLATVTDADCASVLQRFAQADLDVMVWDVTSDIGVAVFYCLIVGRDDRTRDPEFGAGCHPCRPVALLRALTEAAQARTTFIAGARDDFTRQQYQPEYRAQRWQACQQLLQQHDSKRSYTRTPHHEAETLTDDLNWTLAQLQNIGVDEVTVVDLSPPDSPISVVRVVIPGLEGAYQSADSDYVPGVRARALQQ